MTDIHAELAEEYGTKEGSAGVLVSLAAALLAAKMLHSGPRDDATREQLQEQDEGERAMLAMRMQQGNDALRGKTAEALGSELGVLLARAEMDKEAFLGLAGGAALKGVGALAGGAGRLLGAGGKAMGSAGRAVTQGLTGTARLNNAVQKADGVAGFTRALRPSVSTQAGTTLRGVGVQAQGAAKTLQGLGQRASQAGTGMLAKAAPAAAQAAPAVATASAASKPLIGMGTKAKLLGAGLAAGGLYAGYKGLQSAKDYMMQPSGTATFGGPTPGLMHNVNQWGQPQ